jgi:predicted nucleic acid-binding protein
MGSPSFLTEPSALLVVDASGVISLNATGCAATIIRALSQRIVVTEAVQAELASGRSSGRRDADFLKDLVEGGLVEVTGLGEAGLAHFETLVAGPAIDTLDDGEAASIACAAERQGAVILDDAKAIRICAREFPGIRIGCTVDLLSHPCLAKTLSRSDLAEAVFQALQQGRMRVFSKYLNWVTELIGMERAALCRSLPASVRQALGGTIIQASE